MIKLFPFLCIEGMLLLPTLKLLLLCDTENGILNSNEDGSQECKQKQTILLYK